MQHLLYLSLFSLFTLSYSLNKYPFPSPIIEGPLPNPHPHLLIHQLHLQPYPKQNLQIQITEPTELPHDDDETIDEYDNVEIINI